METVFYTLGCLTLFVSSTSAQTSTGGIIRLVGGSDNCRGRLEIMTGANTYNPACSNVVSDNEARVICRMITDCPSEQARRVSLNNFDLPSGTSPTSHPFVYICSGNEPDLNSCYQSTATAKLCEQTINSTTDNIAIECDIRREVNALLIAIVGTIVLVFIIIPIVTYSCIKCFEWIDNR